MGILPILAAVALERSGVARAQELIRGLPAPPTWVGLHVLAARGHIELAANRPQEALESLTAALDSAHARGLDHAL